MSEEDQKNYQAYLEAKTMQNYAKSDELRQLLIAKGIM